MEQLRQQLDQLIDRLSNSEQFRAELDGLKSVYPFSEYEYIISHLLAADKLTIEEYYELRDDYINRNLYLYLFEISAPRGFGEVWAHGHLKELVPSLERPTKKLDPEYSGQYDFFLPPNIRIEVKASSRVLKNPYRRKDEPPRRQDREVTMLKSERNRHSIFVLASFAPSRFSFSSAC